MSVGGDTRMGNEYENAEFDSAAQAAGVNGSDWEGNKAIRVCSTDFHNKFEKWEREAMSFDEMVEWAKDWWQDNGHKYS